MNQTNQVQDTNGLTTAPLLSCNPQPQVIDWLICTKGTGKLKGAYVGIERDNDGGMLNVRGTVLNLESLKPFSILVNADDDVFNDEFTKRSTPEIGADIHGMLDRIRTNCCELIRDLVARVNCDDANGFARVLKIMHSVPMGYDVEHFTRWPVNKGCLRDETLSVDFDKTVAIKDIQLWTGAVDNVLDSHDDVLESMDFVSSTGFCICPEYIGATRAPSIMRDKYASEIRVDIEQSPSRGVFPTFFNFCVCFCEEIFAFNTSKPSHKAPLNYIANAHCVHGVLYAKPNGVIKPLFRAMKNKPDSILCPDGSMEKRAVRTTLSEYNERWGVLIKQVEGIYEVNGCVDEIAEAVNNALSQRRELTITITPAEADCISDVVIRDSNGNVVNLKCEDGYRDFPF